MPIKNSRTKRIILIRHGESLGNKDPNIYEVLPDYALDLTTDGIKQALECGDKLKKIVGNESVMFYVSPFFRTRKTYEKIVSKLSDNYKNLREEPRIREQEWGHLRGTEERDKVTKERDSYGTFYFRIPDGESCADVYDRVTSFMDTLHRDLRDKNFDNVVLVTHGMTIRLFLMRWFKWSVEDFEKLANPENCGIIVMELVNGRYKLKTELKVREPQNKHKYRRG